MITTASRDEKRKQQQKPQVQKKAVTPPAQAAKKGPVGAFDVHTASGQIVRTDGAGGVYQDPQAAAQVAAEQVAPQQTQQTAPRAADVQTPYKICPLLDRACMGPNCEWFSTEIMLNGKKGSYCFVRVVASAIYHASVMSPVKR